MSTPADRFWGQLLVSSLATVLFGIGAFPYILSQTAGSVRAVLLSIAVAIVATVIVLSVVFSRRLT
ncbi:MAG: hypothetical protein WCC60_08760, partial [Ilumatobacteraceae bacterium]